MRSGKAARAVASTEGGTCQEQAEVQPTAVDALSDDNEEADTEMDERALLKSVELELKSFRRSTLVPKAGHKEGESPPLVEAVRGRVPRTWQSC